VFLNPQEVAEQTRKQFEEKKTKATPSTSMQDHYDALRESDRKEKEAQAYAQQLREYNLATQQVAEGNSRVAEAQKVVEQWSKYARSAQYVLNTLKTEGFIPPAPAAPKVVAKSIAVVTQKPVVMAAEPDTYTATKYVPCEQCGANVPEKCAYHKLEVGENLYCIRNAKRAISSGLPRNVVEDNLERVSNLKANQLDQQ
jgi:hypothetical protein